MTADSIKALIGGDLNIASRQDTETQKNQQISAGVGASICVPPFCYGETVTANGNIAAGNMNSNYKAVTDQSGLFAGTGGYDITVGKTTTLQGAVIASDAAANLNNLSTDRLVTSDIKNVSDIKSQSAGFSYSYGSGIASPDPTKPPILASSSTPGGSVPLSLEDSDSSTTHSAISQGTITVRNAAGANDLVGLDRDTAHANNALAKPDEKAMQERMELIQSTVDLAKTSIDDYAQSKSDAAKAVSADPNATQADKNAAIADANSWAIGGDKRTLADVASGFIAAALGGAGAGTAVGIAANTSAADLNAKVGAYASQQRSLALKSGDQATAESWAEGGSSLVLLHGLVGALQGLSSGDIASTAVGTAVVAKVLPAVDQALKQTNLNDDERNALAVMIATGLGAASASAGGGNAVAQINSASNSANEDIYNRQLHQKEADALTKLKQSATPEEAARLDAAACAITYCSASVPPSDKNYDTLQKLQADGANYPQERAELMATGAFEVYTTIDQSNDALLKHDEIIRRAASGGMAMADAAGGISSFALTAAETPLCLTGVGCTIPAVTGTLGVVALKGSMDSTANMIAPYNGTQGDNVLASLNANSYPGESNTIGDYAEKGAPYLVVGAVGGLIVKIDSVIATAESLRTSLVESTQAIFSNLQNAVTKGGPFGLFSKGSAETLGEIGGKTITTVGETNATVDAAANASWMPTGITTKAVDLPVGLQMIEELQASGMSVEEAERYANGYLQSGSTIPVAQTLNPGDNLVNIVPSGKSPSDATGYWTTVSALDAEMANPAQLGTRFGLPPSTANASSYDIYEISPKEGATVFESAVAGTFNSVTGLTQGGGALQIIVPNRSLFSPAQLIGAVTVH